MGLTGYRESFKFLSSYIMGWRHFSDIFFQLRGTKGCLRAAISCSW